MLGRTTLLGSTLVMIAACSPSARHRYVLTPPGPEEPLPESYREPPVYLVQEGGRIYRVHVRRRIPFVVVVDPGADRPEQTRQRYAFPEEQSRILARMQADVGARSLEEKLEKYRALRWEEISRRRDISDELVARMEKTIDDLDAERRDRERELRAAELAGVEDPQLDFTRRLARDLERQAAVYRVRLALILLKAGREGSPAPPAAASPSN